MPATSSVLSRSLRRAGHKITKHGPLSQTVQTAVPRCEAPMVVARGTGCGATHHPSSQLHPKNTMVVVLLSWH